MRVYFLNALIGVRVLNALTDNQNSPSAGSQKFCATLALSANSTSAARRSGLNLSLIGQNLDYADYWGDYADRALT